jgi:hypothetical protein
VLVWNIVPWLLGPTTVKPDAVQLGKGAMELRELLQLLPDLRGVVLGGRTARDGWNGFVEPHLKHSLRVFPTWHPSGQSFAQPGKREDFTLKMERAAALAR